MNSPLNMRQHPVEPIEGVDMDSAQHEGAANPRRRRPAAVVSLTGVPGAESPAALRRLRAAALKPAPETGEIHQREDEAREEAGARGRGDFGEGNFGERRRFRLAPLWTGFRQRAANVKSIFNWLNPPGDDVLAEEKPAPLLQRMAVREFWQSNIKVFNRLFFALPILGAASYLYLVAPDGYRVDTVLAIRNPVNAAAMSGSMSLLSASVASTGQGYAERAIDESFAVVNFIRSREAFNELEKSMKISERFMGPNIDWFQRLPHNADYEARYANYLAHTSVSYSDIEGQITLSTDAFDPETAFQMSQVLARISERLVNKFNERARTDMIRLAQVQLTEAEDGLRSAMLAMTDLQVKNGMLDPIDEASSYTKIIGALREQVAVKRAELGALTSTASPDSPRAVEMRNMLASLESQIRTEQNRLTGRTDALAPLISKFKLLEIDVGLAQQKYNAAAAMVQSALLQSEHQKLYVVNVVSPTPPLESTLPKRFLILLGVVAVTFVVWLIARLILASIRDHSI